VLFYDSRRRRLNGRFETWDQRGREDSLTLPIAAIKQLQAEILGDVVLPGEANYNTDRQLANPRFDYYPEAIIYCDGSADVAACLDVIRSFGLEFVVRSGGHSTGGFSAGPGVVIDLSRLNSMAVDPVALTATAGPGCNFAKFNKELEFHDLHTPGGACPDVCQGGYMQGGGYGYTARIFGMHCDQVTEVTVMLADGSVVVANETVNSDLFWAVRGGTGNNFGIVLSTNYRVYRGSQFHGFSVVWTLDDVEQRTVASNALAWLQENFMATGPADIGYQMIWVFEGPDEASREPKLLLRGLTHGSEEELRETLAAMLEVPGAQLQYLTGPMVYSQLSEHLMTTPYDIPQFPKDVSPYPPPEDKLSRYVSDPVEPAQWLALLNYYVTTPSPYTIVAFEIYGGGINAVDALATAFIHRDVSFDCFCDVFWLNENDRPAMERFLEGWKNLIDPLSNGHSYQNYPSEIDPSYGSHYWGDATWSLRLVKAKYDPLNHFRFAQSIAPLVDEVPVGVFVHAALESPVVRVSGGPAASR